MEIKRRPKKLCPDCGFYVDLQSFSRHNCQTRKLARDLRERGATYKEIAKKAGISAERARQLLKKPFIRKGE